MQDDFFSTLLLDVPFSSEFGETVEFDTFPSSFPSSICSSTIIGASCSDVPVNGESMSSRSPTGPGHSAFCVIA
ncbi:hypothetical protein MD484_g4046, partial [Candolleomyces efflorescens]